MSDVPMELVVAAFPDEDGASQALKDLKEAKKEKLIGIKDAAVIRRGADNKLHIHETGDMSGGRGAVIGGIVGAAIGLVAPPAVLVAGGVGAAIGGLAARLRDSGFPDDRLREFGESLQPGTSALVAVIELKWVEEVERELEHLGARMVTAMIKADIAGQLEAAQVEAAQLETAQSAPASATSTDGKVSAPTTGETAMPGVRTEAATEAAAPPTPGTASSTAESTAPVATPMDAPMAQPPDREQPAQNSPS